MCNMSHIVLYRKRLCNICRNNYTEYYEWRLFHITEALFGLEHVYIILLTFTTSQLPVPLIL